MDSTLDELASGQLFVPPSSAPALKTYSPRSPSVQDHTKFRPAPPFGTVPLAGVGPVQVAEPPSMPRSVGETFGTTALFLTLRVTVTEAGWVTTLLVTVMAVRKFPSTPGSAAIGV